MTSDPKLIPFILPLIDGSRILDVGCGRGKWGYLIKTDLWYTSIGRRRGTVENLIGVDVFRTYLQEVKARRIYDGIVCCYAPFLPFRDGVFDNVLVLEVLEHLKKSDGKNLVTEAERVSYRSVIITVPFFSKGLFAQGQKDGNPFQKHVSQWGTGELKRMKYSVVGHPVQQLLSTIAHVVPFLSGLVPVVPSCIIAKKNVERRPTT